MIACNTPQLQEWWNRKVSNGGGRTLAVKRQLFFLPLSSWEFERPPHTFRYGFSR
jgi:hypothetical protein